jgi:hypothetical protein
VAELPEFYVAYLMQRQAARTDRINAFLSALTPREHALGEQAAVMGYVRGSMAPKGEEIPLNKEILAEVVDACFVYPDLYPVFHADLAPHLATSTWTVETPRREEWGRWSPVMDDPQWAADSWNSAIENTPGWKFRMVRADTTYTVVTEHDPEEEA